MKPLIECLRDEEVGRLLTGEVDAARTSELEQHLANCIDCRQRLEQQVGDDGWWNETESSLRSQKVASHVAASLRDAEDVEPDAARLGETRLRGTRLRESVLDLLGPTDDPNMLGRIGPYEIIGLLGQGGMGAVFKGFDRSLNRFVAIKMLLPHLAASGAARKRFAREGQAVAAVVDDHVMAIHCVDEWQGVPYLVMTYSRGVSLQKRLSDNGPLEVREILRIGMQAAKGLAAAHAQGIVHRDIKPANIFLDQNVERVQLMDFGLARAVDDASLTRSGTLAGTPQYMSPEQARAETVDHRSDLFSLGSVMYAMCTGHAPFRAESSYSVLRLITDKEPRPIREINPDVPEWLCEIISKLMAKQANERFASANEVAVLLEDCLAHVQQPTSAPLPASLVPHATTGRSVFNVTRTGVITMLGIFGMTLLGMVLWPATDPPDISGQWTSDEWGIVFLEAKGPSQYEGTFKDPVKGQSAEGESSGSGVTTPSGSDSVLPGTDSSFGSIGVTTLEGSRGVLPDSSGLANPGKSKSGTLLLKWSRIERRFNGTWGEGDRREGKISLRLVDDEIRGAWMTNKVARKESGGPRLGDLLWKRSVVTIESLPEVGVLRIKGEKKEVESAVEMIRGIVNVQAMNIPKPKRLQIREATVVEANADSSQQSVESKVVEFSGARLRLDPSQPAILTEDDIMTVELVTDPNNPKASQIVLTLTPEAGERFLIETTRLSSQPNPGYLAIEFDGTVLSAPRVNSKISRKVNIAASKEDDIEKLVAAIRESIATQPTPVQHIQRVLTSNRTEIQKAQFLRQLFSVGESYAEVLKRLQVSERGGVKGGPLQTDIAFDSCDLVLSFDAERKLFRIGYYVHSPALQSPEYHELVPDLWVKVKADRQIVNEVVRAFMKDAGDVETTKTLTRDLPQDVTATIFSLASENALNELLMEFDYVNDHAEPTKAIAALIALTFEPQSIGLTKEVFVVFRLTMTDDGWVIDDIDFESKEDADRELKSFLNANPKSVPSITQMQLDRSNARSVVEAYVAAAHAGDVAKAAALAKNSPADPKRIKELPEFLNVQRLKIQTVYVNDPSNPKKALATSVAVKLDEEHNQPDGQRDGFMVFTLELTDDKWFVIDIDFESESGAEKELKRFLEANPNSIGLPPLTSSSMPNLNPATETSDDHDRIQGAWQFDSKSLPTMPAGNQFSVSFLADRMSFSGPQKAGIGTFHLSPDTVPKQIDCRLTFAEKQLEFIGIYEFHDDQLWLCLTEGEQRPKSFDNPPALARLMNFSLERKRVKLPEVDSNASLALSDWSQSQVGAGVFATYTLSIPGIETISQGLAAGGPAVKEFSGIPGGPEKVFTLRYFLPNLSPRGMEFVARNSFRSSLDLIELTQVAEHKRLVKVFSYPDSATEPIASNLTISVLKAGANQADWLKEIDATGEIIYGYEVVVR